jgi:hypothetical protein
MWKSRVSTTVYTAKGRTIRNPGRGGYKIFAALIFFSVLCLCRIFNAFNLCTNFFSRLFVLCCLLAQIFFLWRNGCTNFFPRHFSLHEFFWGNFHPPPPGISNGLPLKTIRLLQYWWKQDWTMLCCSHCSQLPTMLNNIVTPDSGSTILFNIVDKCEQRGPHNIVLFNPIKSNINFLHDQKWNISFFTALNF